MRLLQFAGAFSMKLTKTNWTAAAALIGLGVSSMANADAIPMTWLDTVDFNPDRLVTVNSPVIYNHTLENFLPGTDSVDSYSLRFDLYDDKDCEIEAALFSQPGRLLDSIWFNLTGSENGGWTMAGVWQLETSGRLTIAISSLIGDFYLGGSTLEVKGSRNVPEPDTVALFGAGLLLFGLLRRKRSIS